MEFNKCLHVCLIVEREQFAQKKRIDDRDANNQPNMPVKSTGQRKNPTRRFLQYCLALSFVVTFRNIFLYLNQQSYYEYFGSMSTIVTGIMKVDNNNHSSPLMPVLDFDEYSNYLTIPNRNPNWKQNLQKWQELAKNKTTTPGGWIHVGKAGGTTLGTILPDTDSNMKNLTKYGQLDSFMAQLTIRCHMGSCGLSDQRRDMKDFQLLIWVIRDPFSRTGSAFEYMHPANNLSSPFLLSYYEKSFRCFPTYEKFVYYLDDTTTNSTTDENHTSIKSCRTQAYDFMNHQIGYNGLHFHYDTGYWVNRVKESFPPEKNDDSTAATTNQLQYPYMLVIRNERLWADYKMVNWLLGQNDWTSIQTYENDPKFPKGKDYSSTHKHKNVTRNLSRIGKQRLCHALQREYQDYFWVLQHAANIGPADIEEAVRIAHRNCPNITLGQ